MPFKIWWRLSATFKKWVYKALFGRRFTYGRNVTFRGGFCLYLGRGSISIGNNCYFNRCCSLNVLQGLEIGDWCIFGENVKIYDHNHQFSRTDTPIRLQGYRAKSVAIGNDCWIGSNVVILKGVTIGSGCVVGAGCIVDRDIPENSLVRSGGGMTVEARRNDAPKTDQAPEIPPFSARRRPLRKRPRQGEAPVAQPYGN